MAEKKGLFARLREGLSKTRDTLMGRVDTLVKETRKIDDEFYVVSVGKHKNMLAYNKNFFELKEVLPILLLEKSMLIFLFLFM